MKKLLLFTAIIFGVLITFAQAPEKFSYQAVIRNASNALVTNANVGMKISILKTSAAGTVVYSESQTAMTNINGLVSIQIGAGNVIMGTIAGINWGAYSYYIKTETDPAGGTNYTIAGTTQLLSVPYALYSKNSGSGSGLTLPYAGTSSADNVTPFTITNSGTSNNPAGYFINTDLTNYAPALFGENKSTEGSGAGVTGGANANTTPFLSAGVRGYVVGSGSYGAGVSGDATNGFGVYGSTTDGRGVYGYSVGTGTAGFFQAYSGGYALRTDGALKFDNGTQGAGKVLTSDVAGNATSQDNGTPFIHFSSTKGSGQTIIKYAETVINSWTGLEETGGSNYNATTGEYTIPVTGYYTIKAHVSYTWQNTEDNDTSSVAILLDGDEIQLGVGSNAIAGKYYPDTSVIIEKKLNAGQKVSIMVAQAGAATNDLRKLGTTFSIDLLHK